ncbi:MAG: MipA/OmpV family protein [Burkholderiales bacterium]|nr:MipA/OmpV family protein [Burkholderiales bacterium]
MKPVVWVGLALFAVIPDATAQPAVPPLWEVGVFAGAASTPAYPASTERTYRGLVLPYLIYRGDIVRVDRGGIGARLLHTDTVELDVGFAASLPASSSDIAARKDMPDLGTLIEFGPRLKGTLAKTASGGRVRFELPLRSVLEINNGVRSQGYALEPEVVYEMRDVGGNWRLSTSLSAVMGDRALNQYFYGVPAAFATAQRPVYEARAGLIATRLTFNAAKSIGPDLRVYGFARYESYAHSANQNSPLYLQTTGTSIGMGVSWTLGRSTTSARD